MYTAACAELHQCREHSWGVPQRGASGIRHKSEQCTAIHSYCACDTSSTEPLLIWCLGMRLSESKQAQGMFAGRRASYATHEHRTPQRCFLVPQAAHKECNGRATGGTFAVRKASKYEYRQGTKSCFFFCSPIQHKQSPCWRP